MPFPKTDLFEALDPPETAADGGLGDAPFWPADRLVGWADSRELRYDSTDDRGQARRYSARVYLPVLRARRKARGLPLVVFIHATLGQWDQVPQFNRGPEALAGALAANLHHFAVAMPDMPGHGKDPSSRPHPFAHARSLAPAVLDLIQPSLALLEAEGLAWDGRVFLVGYSSGGYAALAAVKAWHQDPRFAGVPLTGAACMAAGFRQSETIRTVLRAPGPFAHLDVLPTQMIAYQDLYPDAAACRLEQCLDPRLLEVRQGGLDEGRLQDWIHGTLSSEAICRNLRQRLTGSPTTPIPLRALVQPRWLAEQFDHPDWPNTEVGLLLRENDLIGGWRSRVPILLASSPGDECVAPENTEALMADWAGQGAGAPVTFLPLTLFGHALKHRAAAIPALAQAFRWCARQPRA